jgi:tetratricopeptide (TPR) repeat protein
MANSARIDELRKKFDENPRRYFAPLANEYRKSGDLAQAVFILEEYLPQQPGHISGHIVYGQTLFELGRDEEAKRVFETALSLDPENLIALRHLGHISRQAGDFDAARIWYQRLLEADPRDVEIEQLLGSLDSAAQAQAASMARPSASPVLPPPALPSVVTDDSPLQIERAAEGDAPGAGARASTHPLAPPPLPMTPEPPSAGAYDGGERTISDAALEPPPLPVSAAESHADDELFDLNDFSFDFPSSTPAPAVEPSAPVAEQTDAPESHAVGEESPAEPQSDAHDEWAGRFPPIGEDEGEGEESAGMSAPVPEAAAESESAAEPESAAESDSIPPDVPVAFEPFSGLEPQAAESEEKNVDGLETYAFESPTGPVVDPSEDAGSFYMMDPTYATPPEPIEPAPGFESNEEEFVAEMSAEATQVEALHEDAVPEEVHPPEAVAVEPTPVEPEPIEAAAIEAPSVPVHPSTSPPAEAPIEAPSVPAHPSTSPPADEVDAFATETMAQLYINQGHLESALGIYRTIAVSRPDDEGLRRRIDEIEDRVQRRRREPTPPAPMRTTPVEAAVVEAIVPVAAEETPAPRTDGPTIRDFMVGILRRAGSGVGDQHAESNGSGSDDANGGGTIDALFGGGAALDDDLAAADTLAQAFAPEVVSEPLTGNPARTATSELSLDSVFRQPTAAHAGDERSSGGFSFDEFFADDIGNETGAGGSAAATPGDPEDLEQFNDWLNGLKKS